MGYSTGILNHRVTILNKVAPSAKEFGSTTTFEPVVSVWANVTWSKGVRSLREGALDAYDTVLIRMRWNDYVTRDSQLQCEGKTYQIQSLHADRIENIVQITATEMTTK